MLLQNTGECLPDYMVSHSNTPHC